MPIKPGTRIGPYEVVGTLGAGGMGDVYRARDTKLDRDVALKILPESFASDPDRLMRFEREAKTLAALNHPNIAAIYGLEGVDLRRDSGSTAALDVGGGTDGQATQTRDQTLVMELVDGEDLSQLIARGALPLDDALPIARQIADALEAAHEAGIVHRDLKPANIKVREDGTVKVLDFGLAKAVEPAPEGQSAGNRSPTLIPTMTSPALTEMGLILGTAAYMSPEQARGRPVDRRADIWAFGCVLFEMLAGRRPFMGDDISTMLASVLKDDVPWDALPDDLPAPIIRLLRRSLEKDPRNRLSAIGDARLELDEAAADESAAGVSAPVVSSRSIPRLMALLAAAVVVTAALTLWLSGGLGSEVESPQRVTVLAPAGEVLYQDAANIAISPDGQRLAFVTGSSVGETRLWIRMMEDLVPREVEGATGAILPFWSPDSATIAFFADGKLMTAPVAGGRPQAIADAPAGRGGTWNADGVIVFSPTNAGSLSRVSSNGGTVTEVTTLASESGETGHRWPSFLPDGRHFLFAALPAKGGEYDIYVGALDSTDRQFVLTAEGAPVFAEPGYLIYTRRGVLVAHPFNASQRALTGEALPLGDTPGEMRVLWSAGWPASVTNTGDLAYLTAAGSRSRLAWLDATGRETATTDVPPGPYVSVSLSRDERFAALTRLDASQHTVWLADLSRGGMTPVTTRESGWDGLPELSPDGRRIAFSSDRDGPIDLFLQVLDSTDAEPLFQSDGLFKHAISWSPDGQIVVYSDSSPETGLDLWTIRPDGDRTPRPFSQTPGNDAFGALSPDGRWMAYINQRSGRYEAWIQAFPGPGTPIRLTTNGTLDWGIWWRDDGRQLLILDASLQLLLIDVQTSPELSANAPRVVGNLAFPPVAARSIAA
ncbi:MAG: protein kinase, partial [Acidobacteriota bacterium]